MLISNIIYTDVGLWRGVLSYRKLKVGEDILISIGTLIITPPGPIFETYNLSNHEFARLPGNRSHTAVP